MSDTTKAGGWVERNKPRTDHSRTESEEVQAELLTRFTYDPFDGLFRSKKTGKPIGHLKSSGYMKLCLCGTSIYLHRAAFFLMNGRFPQGVVDHKNNIRTDNRWENLRDVTIAENNHNLGKATVRNTYGLLGVSKYVRPGYVKAVIRVGKKEFHLGVFKTPEEAHEAYMKAKREKHIGFVEAHQKGTA